MPILKPARGIQINKSLPLAHGLVGCWLFNEGGGNTVFDLSGNNLHGTLQGTASWALEGVLCDASGESILVNGNPFSSNGTVFLALDLGDAPSSYTRLLNAHTATGSSTMVLRRNVSDTSLTFELGTVTANFTVEDIWNTGPHQIAATWNDANDKREIFIDAKSQGTSSISFTMSSDTTEVYFGNRQDGAYYCNGVIKYVYIWDRELSSAEINLLCREPFYVLEQRLKEVFFYVTAGGIVNFEGASTGQSASSGTILVSIRVNGSVTSSTESTAIVKLTRKAVGVCLSTSDVTAILKTKQNIVGQLNTTTKVSGLLTLTGEIALVGATNALSVFSGMLTFIFFEPWFIASLNIERNWLVAALFVGMTSDAFKLSTVLSLGWFWMRTAGCTALYRGLNRNRIDLANALAVVENHVDIISPPKYLPHYNDTAYYYLIRRFNNCGYQERTLQAATKIQIDPSSKLTQPQPNSIFIARAEQIGTNKIKLLWFYCPIEQKSAPGYFKVCSDKGTGQIDYKNPIATIDYKGSKFYSYECSELNAERYLFAVKTENAAGKQDSSLARLSIQLSDTNLEPINIINAESI